MMKFQCLKCGGCCKNFSGNTNNRIEVPSFIGESNRLITLSKTRLTINDWEKGLFNEEFLDPDLVFFDLKNEETIVLNYSLNIDECPLLKENQCSAYDKRPINCRIYPCPYGDLKMLRSDPRAHLGLCKGELSFKELHKLLGFNEEGGGLKGRSGILKKIYI